MNLISDRRFKDTCVRGVTSEHKDIKLMMYRDPTFDIDQMQTTMRHLYPDDLSRGSSTEKIAGRGTAMSAETSACDCCGKKGHQEGNCWKKRDETKRGNKKHLGSKARGAGQRWCSVHKTTSHSDEKCYAQGAPRPEPGAANLASSAPTSFNFDDDFDKGFSN